ncbi:PREDICTED: probable prolyl 4-hydroxylase 9 [Populus euphratica]|uniref:procollagen-proline 4-dioxygenase n=1 Tax=Populus euphratica TaxID=75702 RepID=A0AAJ6SZ30_POPEU|nr:PREDICTED: probable prolyl 4-hydroxylase 9 [Populus euphratica]
MKIKTKRSKRKLGLPAAIILCSLFFLAGFYSSIFFPHDVPVTIPRLRMLEVAEGDHDTKPHGLTGEASVESIPFQVLSWKPRALYFPKFATPEQCESIIKMVESKLKPSTLALRKGETAESTKGTRTSSGSFVSGSEDETGTLDFIEKKIAKATMIPQSHGEAFNILRYEIGQKYDSHYDVFNPDEYGPQSSQRAASFLLYLSNVEEGGETMFPFENGSGVSPGFDYKQCVGLKVKPRQGDGLLFYSLFPNGTIDPTSLHGSCPVIKGVKWVATKWIRDQIWTTDE